MARPRNPRFDPIDSLSGVSHCKTYQSMAKVDLVPVKKLSIALPPDIAAAVAASASQHGESVSAWIDRAARSALRLEEGLTAMDGYEEEFGAFTEEEKAAADAILDRHFGVSSPAP